MNAVRVAAALRLLADAIEEDEQTPPLPRQTPMPPRRAKRLRGVRTIEVPPVDDVTAKRAEMVLRRAGVYKVRP
jgi:hypothetical protein